MVHFFKTDGIRVPIPDEIKKVSEPRIRQHERAVHPAQHHTAPPLTTARPQLPSCSATAKCCTSRSHAQGSLATPLRLLIYLMSTLPYYFDFLVPHPGPLLIEVSDSCLHIHTEIDSSNSVTDWHSLLSSTQKHPGRPAPFSRPCCH